MTLAIAHHESEKALLDHLSEVRPPFSPDAVVDQFAAVLARWNLRKATLRSLGRFVACRAIQKARPPHESTEKPRACTCRASGRQPYRGWFLVGWRDPRNRPQRAPRTRRSSLRPEPPRYYGAPRLSPRPIRSHQSSLVCFEIGS